MKNFNWGTGLVIFFTLYISYLVITVVMSTRVDHSLVVDDYYQHDIAYQDLYLDATENRNNLKNDLAILINEEAEIVNFEFGENTTGLQGEILFYRPSAKASDVKNEFELATPEHNVVLPTSTLIKGKWIIKVRWNDGITHYYKEESIII